MKLKVTQTIKGLVPGDILYYINRGDNRGGLYEINKVEEDISDTTSTKKQLKVTIDEWYVKNWKDYFTYIDDDDNEIVVEELEYINGSLSEQYQTEISDLRKEKDDLTKTNTKLEEDIQAWQSEVIKLNNKIIDLQKQLEAVTPKQVVREVAPYGGRIVDLPRLYFNW